MPIAAASLTLDDLNAKTKAQLIALAKEQLELDLDASIRKDELVNRIAAALPQQPQE